MDVAVETKLRVKLPDGSLAVVTSLGRSAEHGFYSLVIFDDEKRLYVPTGPNTMRRDTTPGNDYSSIGARRLYNNERYYHFDLPETGQGFTHSNDTHQTLLLAGCDPMEFKFHFSDDLETVRIEPRDYDEVTRSDLINVFDSVGSFTHSLAILYRHKLCSDADAEEFRRTANQMGQCLYALKASRPFEGDIVKIPAYAINSALRLYGAYRNISAVSAIDLTRRSDCREKLLALQEWLLLILREAFTPQWQSPPRT